MAASVMYTKVPSLIMLLCLSVTYCYSKMSNSITDQQALLSFKNSIVYDPSNSLQNWDTNVSLCNWSGVQCSLWSQSVISLNISGMNIQGPISPFLANISFLELLDLSDNHFYGHIPTQVGKLGGLKKLVLDGNNLEGSIPTSLMGCINLTVLSLSHNQLRGHIPAELSLLTNIQILDLGLNNFTGNIPFTLGNLNLVRLDLGENKLYGPIPASLSNCTLLSQLVLKENQLNGPIPSDFGTKLKNLQELHLWGNRLVGGIPISLTNCSLLRLLFLNENLLSGVVPVQLGKLALIETLYLHENQLVSTPTLPFLMALTNCSHLQKIDVSNNPLRGVLPSSIGQFSNKLSLLDLSNNSIWGSIPPQIGNLTSLTYLALADNLLSGSIPSELKMLNRLERLRLRNNRLQGSIPSEISQLRNLGSLSIRQNMLSGQIPHSIGELQHLRRLLLSENQLTGRIPPTLGNCWRMEMLDLSWNRFTGSIPREFGGLSNLQFYFNLSHNALEGSLPPELGKMIMVQTIDISFNELTGVIPDALGSCTGLLRLNLSHNSLEGPIPQSLSAITYLEKLDLSSNKLSGTIPKSLGKLHMLHTVNFSFNNLSGDVPTGWFFANIAYNSLMGNPGLCGPQAYLLDCQHSNRSKQTNRLLVKILIVVIPIVAALGLCCLLIRSYKPNIVNNWISTHNRSFSFPHGPPMISYEELRTATDGFNEANIIGFGSFGSVYKGILSNGTAVAIKVFNLQNMESYKSFITECKIYGRVRHRNIVRVVNYCSTLRFKALVLHLMPGRSLEDHLHHDGVNAENNDVCSRLSLSQRLSISMDIAHGLEYLHHHCFMQVVHCDLKPSNVLLDSKMTAHLCDFGIARLTCGGSMDTSSSVFAFKGSIGYIAPEYGLGSSTSTKGDVYSFGIVLLEIVTGKRPTDNMFVGGINLRKWVSMACHDRLMEVADTSLLEDANSHEIEKCIAEVLLLGLLCTRESPEQRPIMTEVVALLEIISRNLLYDRS